MTRIIPDDSKEVKTKAVSDAEIAWISDWQTALNRGLLNLARDLLETGTDFEHFRALLNEDETTWTADQIADLEKYRVAFQNNRDILNPPPPLPPPPDPVLVMPKGTVAAYDFANTTAWDNFKVVNLADGGVLLPLEPFDNPTTVFANWIPVIAGPNYGTAKWTVEGGMLKEVGGGTGSGHPWQRGAHAYYRLGFDWVNYQIEFDITSTDDDPMGVLFRFTSQANCYRFAWGHQQNDPNVRGRQLVRMKNDQPTYLYKDQIGYGYNTGPKHIVVRVNGNAIDVSINGVLLVAGRDALDLVGLGMWNFQLSDPPRSALLPL